MIITTSPNRVKAGGYWCEDGDAEANRLITLINKDSHPNVYTLDSEIDLRDMLDYIGLSSTLLSLGQPRKMYLAKAEKVLNQYIAYLFDNIEVVLISRLGKNIALTQERLRYDGVDNYERRKKLLDKWLKLKYSTEQPDLLNICSAMVILLSEYPLNIKAVHATKALLSVEELANQESYNKIEAKLGELLDA